MAGTERESVVTTENLLESMEAKWKPASPMPMTGAAVEAAGGVEAGVVEAGDDHGVDAGVLARRPRAGRGRRCASS